MADHEKSERGSNKSVVRTGGKTFPDGSSLELIRTSNGQIRLLNWDGKSAKTAAQFMRHGETFAPLHLDPSISHWLQLPSNIAQYGSTRQLFTGISELISRTEFGNVVMKAASFTVFASWLAQFLPVAPFLWIVVPPTAAVGPLLQVLHLLCRRSLIVSELSARQFRFLPVDLCPTLLIEVSQQSREVLKLLRASRHHRALIAADSKAVDAFGARIVFAPEPLRDPESAGFPLEVVLPPTSKYIPLLNSSEAERVGAEFQAKLLQYRISNWAKVLKPAFDLNQFTIPMRELAYSLGASILDDQELQSQIVPLLKTRDREIRVDLTSLLTAIVLEALLARCHNVTGKYFPVADLTGDVNTTLRGRGETLEVSPERLGWVLRALGLHRDFIPGGRKGLLLTSDVRKKIHELALAYGVRTLRELPEKVDCSLCAALALPWKIEANTAGSLVDPA